MSVCDPHRKAYINRSKTVGDTKQIANDLQHYYMCVGSPELFVICWVSPMVTARVTCAFCFGSHTFPEKIMTGIVFYIGHGLLPVLVCDITNGSGDPTHT